MVACESRRKSIRNRTARTNDQSSTLLPRIALHSTLPVPAKERAEIKPPRDWIEHRPNASAKTSQSIRVPLRVAHDCDVADPKPLLKRFRRRGPTASDDNEIRPQRAQFRNSRPQLGHLVTAKRSAKVPNENQHSRSLAPKLPERDLRASRLLHDNISERSCVFQHGFTLLEARPNKPPRLGMVDCGQHPSGRCPNEVNGLTIHARSRNALGMKTIVGLATAFAVFVSGSLAVAREDPFDREMCKKLEPILSALGRLQAKNKVVRYKDSEFAGSKWQVSLDTLWALKDKLRDQTVGFSKDEPSYLGYFLTASEQPSVTGRNNPYVNVSKEMTATIGKSVAASYEMALAAKIAKSRGNLHPAQVFTMAVEATNGDLPLAMIVAHNLLKEAAYAKREGSNMSIGYSPTGLGKKAAIKYRQLVGVKNLTVASVDSGTEFLMHPSYILDKLSNLRPDFDKQKSDKEGPWYHAFGLLFYGSTAQTGRYGAQFLAGVENVTRYIGIGSKRSYGKEALNRCAGQLVGKMNDLEKTYDARRSRDADKAAAIKFKGRLIQIRDTVEAYKWGKKVARFAKDGVGSPEEVRTLVRTIYGTYPQGSKLRDAFRRGYVAGQ
jgi:hypothetical protein